MLSSSDFDAERTTHRPLDAEKTATRSRLTHPDSPLRELWLRHMPCAIEETVAVGLAWRSILFEGVEWLTLICPHLLAVVTYDDCHIGGWLGIVCGHQRWPVFRAGALTH